MTLLEVIENASVSSEPLVSQSEYPIVLNPDDVLPNLRPKLEYPNLVSLVNPVVGWQISKTDSEVIDLGKNFFTKLNRKLKNPNDFDKDEFIRILNQFLEKIRDKAGVSIGIDSSDKGYTVALIEKLGSMIGKDVAGLVLDACVVLETWELVEALIVNGHVEHSCYSTLVNRLVVKKMSDLICVCIKHASDLGASELLCILKYFLSPPKDAYISMVNVRKEWEKQALSAIERASDKGLTGKKARLAKDASISLMMAHDGFSAPEICLHYLLASSNVDAVVLASSISKLNGKEMMSLIRYLGKWLKKYERFPQAVPCSEASSKLGLKACCWVPKLEDVINWVGLVLDEKFSSLVLHPEFHEELRSMEGMVSSLALEARVCCSMANVVEKLIVEV
ncbi:uncharacterized protein LOC121235714 [Juglans microcarpa x Juglans regia]|uniref:uncharacterized protein LOC121235714 n=1 Tax=Juglans microcarpa x Juglans regia TaxID=2249226 RepID=UPI001B7EA805|nr:uncharacterized protein LOC121235714 [Juglans microcarpa x Juglans regia]